MRKVVTSNCNHLLKSFIRSFSAWCHDDGYLDTERLRNISYGNLVLRHHEARFLGYGVMVALTLFALFWYAVATVNIIAAGKKGIGIQNGGSDDRNRNMITLVQIIPPPFRIRLAESRV